jgi:glycosyltransferase XagB
VTVLGLVVLLAAVFLSGLAALSLWWSLYAWHTPTTLASTAFGSLDEDGQHVHERRRSGLTFTLLLAARHEEAVLATTVHQLLRTDYLDVEVLIIVGHDDPGTANIAHALSVENPDRVRVVVDRNPVKTKARALNVALPECRGDVVGVIDAEDIVHPMLLGSVAAVFLDDGADVVQGAVQLMDIRSRWFSLRNCLEYYFWFRSRLHLQASKGFIPLGGNTVFARTELLRELGGWDPDCLAEDCELGVRLSTRGAKVVVAYDPEMSTREETPPTLASFVKQRTRWNQGFLQVYRKGEWKALPTRRQRLTARLTLGIPLAEATMILLIPLAPLAILLVHVNVLVAMVACVPALLVLATIAFECVGLAEFSRQYCLGVGARDYARLILTLPVYALVLAYAAARAVVREMQSRHDWELTEHVGNHMGAVRDASDDLVVDVRDASRELDADLAELESFAALPLDARGAPR